MKKETKNLCTSDLLKNVKSKYIVKQIFKLLKITRSLNIIKYNKFIQERCDINLGTYIKVFKKINQIVKKIIPKNNFGVNKNKNFINIENTSDEKYCHIYFNNKKEEIKRNYYTEDDNVSSIKIILDYNINSLHKLFERCICIKKIYFNIFRKNITDMSYMFFDCSSIEEINFVNFNTDIVTDMSFMFSGCKSIEELDLSCFNTENVTDMKNMFNDCRSLKELNISSFDTQKVTDMKNMFNNCEYLKELNISNFNTRNVADMRSMFSNCTSLTHLDLSNFNTRNVMIMNKMFFCCTNLSSLDISNFSTYNVTHMNKMFWGCRCLREISDFYFNTENVIDMNDICYKSSYEIQTKIRKSLSHFKCQ